MARAQAIGRGITTVVHDRTGAATALARSLPLERIGRVASYVTLGALIGLGLLVTASTMPTFFGYHTYVVNGGSMEPNLPRGSVAVAKATSPGALGVGDIIARQDGPAGEAVLHRIVDIGANEDGEQVFVTQGDRNQAADITPVVLVGAGDRVVYSVPYAGYFLNFAGSFAGRFLLVVTPLALLAFLTARDVRGWLAGAALTEAAPVTLRPPASERLEEAAPAALTPAPSETFEAEPVSAIAEERAEAERLDDFLLRHSGESWRSDQCWQHGPIDGMATLELLAALRDEAGLSLPMQAVLQACDDLEIARPAGHGGAQPLRLAA